MFEDLKLVLAFIKEGIDYTKTFSLVSKKDSLRIILALVAHFDLKLH